MIPKAVKYDKGITKDADLTADTKSLVNAEGIGAKSNQIKKNLSVFEVELIEINPRGRKIIEGIKRIPVYIAECLGFCQSPLVNKKYGEK